VERAVLLVLLGIPVLVGIHVALSQSIPPATANQLMAFPVLHSEGRWRPSEAIFPTHFVINPTAEQGS